MHLVVRVNDMIVFFVHQEYPNWQSFENSNPLATGLIILVVELEDMLLDLLSFEAKVD